ncbi:MAG: cob(I)yrinic acid a,c-diamide adenosyltransferase [Candidatus Kryptoniota bacterium]
MKLYTGTGDKGETSLFGGKRISKDAPRIEAYGTVDELNSVIGVARSFVENERTNGILRTIQEQLFILGADLATPRDEKIGNTAPASNAIKRISTENCVSLERIIDEIDEQLAPLKSFILPGGSKSAALLHHARTVCRRAERQVISMREESSEHTVIFLNRLSDLLFVLARYANKLSGVADTPWNPRNEPNHPA